MMQGQKFDAKTLRKSAAPDWNSLSQIDEWLKAHGWIIEDEGFRVPDKLFNLELWKVRLGGGLHYNRANACFLQIQASEASLMQTLGIDVITGEME